MKPINSLPKRQQSTSRIDRTANPKDDPRVETWDDPPAAENPKANRDQRGNHYEYTGGQSVSRKRAFETSFHVDDIPDKFPKRREQLFERIWRVDGGRDVDPGDPKFGAEVGHYADSTVDTEFITTFDRFKYHLSDTSLQRLELPRLVRDHSLYLINNCQLREFNSYGGVDGAIIGLTMKTLAGHLGLQKVADLEDTVWWSRIRSIANELEGVMGATGRTFRQLITHVEEDYEPETGGPT